MKAPHRTAPHRTNLILSTKSIFLCLIIGVMFISCSNYKITDSTPKELTYYADIYMYEKDNTINYFTLRKDGTISINGSSCNLGEPNSKNQTYELKVSNTTYIFDFVNKILNINGVKYSIYSQF